MKYERVGDSFIEGKALLLQVLCLINVLDPWHYSHVGLNFFVMLCLFICVKIVCHS